MLLFDICRPAFCYHYDIKASGSQDNTFYCRVKPFTHHTPDLVLYAGPDKASTPVAMSHILQFSQSFKIGFGMEDTQWEDMIRKTIGGADHCWGMSIPDGSETRRLQLVWRRTTSITAEGSSKPVVTKRGIHGHRGWKLVSEDDGEKVLAVFTYDKAFGRRGVVEINVDYGEEFVYGVLLTVISLYERSER